jgi:two-component system response regulator MprA
VIDDEPQIRETLCILLEDAGHSVALAAGGQEGLAALRRQTTPLVVLLDVLMPEMDGLAMLRQVVADPALRKHGYILMTAESQRLIETAAHVFAALPVTVVRKPFDIDDVTETVAAVAARLSDSDGASGASSATTPPSSGE